MQQTRLKQVRQGGDLELSGEITNYDAYNKGVVLTVILRWQG